MGEAMVQEDPKASTGSSQYTLGFKKAAQIGKTSVVSKILES